MCDMQVDKGGLDVHVKPVHSASSLHMALEALMRERLSDLLPMAARHILRSPIPLDEHGNIADVKPDGSRIASIAEWYRTQSHDNLRACAQELQCADVPDFIELVRVTVKDANKVVHPPKKRWAVVKDTIRHIVDRDREILEGAELQREWQIFCAAETIRDIPALGQR